MFGAHEPPALVAADCLVAPAATSSEEGTPASPMQRRVLTNPQPPLLTTPTEIGRLRGTGVKRGGQAPNHFCATPPAHSHPSSGARPPDLPPHPAMLATPHRPPPLLPRPPSGHPPSPPLPLRPPSATGPGPIYLWKPLFHLVLPRDIRRVIVLDTDLFFFSGAKTGGGRGWGKGGSLSLCSGTSTGRGRGRRKTGFLQLLRFRKCSAGGEGREPAGLRACAGAPDPPLSPPPALPSPPCTLPPSPFKYPAPPAPLCRHCFARRERGLPGAAV
jgi:hypothetical protein